MPRIATMTFAQRTSVRITSGRDVEYRLLIPGTPTTCNITGMRSVEDYIESYRAALQEAIPEEPVWGLGLLSTVGATKSAMTGFISPLAGMIMRRKGKAKAPGFPTNVVMAVTPSRIIAFGYRPSYTKIKLKKRVAEWPRQSVQAQIVPPAKARGLDHALFRFPDGSAVELEIARSFAKYSGINDSFYHALGLAVPA